MEIHDSDILTELAREAEILLSRKVHCIFHRESLAITSGESIYSLPTGLYDIMRITWLGNKLEPWNPEQFSGFNLKPHVDASESTPQFYMLLGYDYDKIRFYPTPPTSIDAISSSAIDKGASVDAGVIISGWRAADPTGETYRIPDWIRDLLTYYYKTGKAFMYEGQAQDQDIARIYLQQFEQYANLFKDFVMKIPSSVEHRFGPPNIRSGRPPRPVLPSNFPRS